jgi:FlaG/FlaF family flagellin (archaellin)
VGPAVGVAGSSTLKISPFISEDNDQAENRLRIKQNMQVNGIEQISGDNIAVEEEKFDLNLNFMRDGNLKKLNSNVSESNNINNLQENSNNPNSQRYQARETRSKKSKDFAGS